MIPGLDRIEGKAGAGARSRAAFVALTYGAIAVSWILASDHLVALVFDGTGTIAQTGKGLAFVLTTAGLLYALLHRWERQIRSAEVVRGAFKSIHDRLDEGVLVVDLESWHVVDCNAAIERLLGYRPDELIGSTAEHLHPSDEARRRFLQTFRAGLQSKGAVRGEHQLRTRAGEVIDVEYSVGFLGDPKEIVVVFRDITAAKVARDTIAAQEAFLRALLTNVSDVVAVAEPDGTLAFVSDSSARVLGHSARDLIGRSCLDLVHPDDIDALTEDLREAIAQPGTTRIRVHRMMREDGTWATVESTLVLPLGRGAPGVIVSTRDITARRSAELALAEKEEQLARAQRMEPVGRLASGVAHDFNNILTIILSYSGLLIDDLEDADARADLEAIQEAAGRAAQLTHQLLLFSRHGVVEAKRVDIREAIVALEKMLVRVIGEDVALSIDVESDLPPVFVDAGQLSQVVLNLAVNARDAMPRGGTLRIAAHPRELAGPAATRLQLEPGPYVCLEVADDGVGMDTATISRIFDPFFTTKEPGKGTGLGLATAFGIVTRAGGAIDVVSRPGQGATFQIYLPPAGDDTRAEAPASPRADASRRGDETILLVEDDAHVRTAVHRILERVGYDVLVADSVEHALGIVEGRDGALDLVLTDVVMPSGSGRVLVERMRALRHDTPVLYMTGYTADRLVDHELLRDDIAVLQKPFTEAQLLEHVHRALRLEGPSRPYVASETRAP